MNRRRINRKQNLPVDFEILKIQYSKRIRRKKTVLEGNKTKVGHVRPLLEVEPSPSTQSPSTQHLSMLKPVSVILSRSSLHNSLNLNLGKEMALHVLNPLLLEKPSRKNRVLTRRKIFTDR
jgi:hypothetical protein